MNTAACEFGHLLQRMDWPPFGAWWSHVHEDDALSCAVLVDMGWPDPRLARR